MKPFRWAVRSIRDHALGWSHADGVLHSANVPRPCPPCRPQAGKAGKAPSFISLRGAHHRRGLAASRRIRQHDATCPRPRVSGGPCSEIKEEPGPPAAQAGDIRGRGHPVASACAPHPRGTFANAERRGQLT